MNNIKKLKQQYNESIIAHEWKKAIQILNTIITDIDTPKNATFLLRRAMVFYRLKMWEETLADVVRALEMDNSLVQAQKIKDIVSAKLNKDSALKNTNENDITIDELLAPNSGPSSAIEETKETHQQIDRYIVLEELGRGGMGKVYKVFDPKLDRTVALKVLLEGSSANPERVQRFLREAKATAKLHHQNIVALHDIGQHDGFVFFTMDYIEGETFKNYMLRVSPSIKEIVALTTQIANAIDYAHNQGIVHRDLKPTNIMINKNGETKIMDFGLAKILHSDDDLSRTGDSMGTPAYMSPEQADGRKVDARTDVYALGAILYQSLTSRPPFQGDHYYNVIFQVLNTEPVLPRKLNPSVPIELEAICLKCLEKRVEKRYLSAMLLVQDLQNFSNNRPITAKSATILTLATKFIKRHRTWAITSFLVILCLIGGAISTFVQWQKTIEQKNIIEEDRKNTTFRLAKITLSKAKESFLQNSEEDKRWNKCGVLATAAIDMIKNYDGKEKELLVKEAQSLVSTSLKRNGLMWETYCFGVAPVREDYTSSKPERFEKANLQVAFAGSYIMSGSWDGKITFYDGISGKRIKQIVAHHREIKHMIYRSQKNLFAFASDDDQVSLWDYQLSSDTLQEQNKIQSLSNNLNIRSVTSFIHGGYVSSVAISPKDKFLGCGGKDGICKIWDLSSYDLVANLKHGIEEITSITFSQDEKLCITASKNEIKVWNIKNKHLVGSLVADTDTITNLIFSPTQSVLISTSANALKTWSFPDFKLINSLEIKDIVRVCFNNKGTTIACTNKDGNIFILNSESQNIQHTFKGHTATVTSINFSPDDNYLVSASADNSIKMWHVATAKQIYKDNGHSNAIEDVAFHPGGKIIASASYDGTVRLWDVFDGKEISQLSQNNQVITSCNFSHQGNLLVTGSQNGTINIWDWRNRKIIQHIKAHENSISRVVFHPNDSLLASSSVDMMIYIWDATTGQKKQEIKLHKKYVWDVSFHPTKNWIASASEDEFVYIWDLDEKKIINKVEHNLGGFVTVSFSPDGKKLAYGGEDKNVHIWDYINNAHSTSLSGHLGPINGIAFDTSGNFIASCSDDQTIKIWDIENEIIVKEFSSFHWLNDIAFSPNEPMVVGGGQDGIVRLWYIEHMQKQIQELKKNCFALCTTLDGKRFAYIEDMSSVDIYSYETGHIENIYKSPTPIFCLDISNDGKWIALGGENGTIKIIDTATKKILHTLEGHTAHLWCVHFNPEKTILVSSSKDRTIRLWNVDSGEEIKVISEHALSVYKVTFSPDGKLIASASEDRTIKIWDAETGEKLHTINEQEHVTLNVKFSPDSKKLGYTASQNGYIWDIEKKQKTYLYGHTGFLTSIDFSPDGKLVATGSYDKDIRLWNAETGVEEDKLIGHYQTIFSALFHPTDPILISIGEDATMRFWDLKTPYYNIPRTVPLWLDEIVSHAYLPSNSQNLYRNISADIIEQYLQSNPSSLGQLLFQFEVKETLDLKISLRPNYIWNNQSRIDPNTLQSYIENAKTSGLQENKALSYLQTVLKSNPQMIDQIRESFPKLAPKLAQRLLIIAQQQGNIEEAQKKYQQVLILEPQNQEATLLLESTKK